MQELKTAKARLTIDETMGGRANSWQIEDLQILKPTTDQAVVGGWYAMAPWAGRITENQISFNNKNYPQKINLDEWAIHGTVFDSPGEVINQGSNYLQVRHLMTAEWLAPGEIIQEWKLDDNYLFTAIEIRTFKEEFPASCGWHPWFLRKLNRGEPAVYSIAATNKYQRGADYLPTGKLIDIGVGPFDDAFTVPSGKAQIIWPQALEIQIETNCPVFVLYDLPEDSFCIEPSSGYPDQINRKPIVVSQENPLRIESTWRAKLL